MSNSRPARTVVLTNPEGLHLRAATTVRERVLGHDVEVELVKGQMRANAMDVLQMAALCAEQGEELRLEASGPEAEAMLDELVRLIANQFDNHEPD
jgi:phosphotransferase system HPr (HPr) family protein